MFTFFVYLYLSFVAVTSRIRVTSESEETASIFRETRPAVYTYWFEHVYFLLYYLGKKRMPMLMTPKGKTDLFTKLAEWMRVRVARGSLEGGGRHALVMLLEKLKAGEAVAVPADSSHGPKHKCKAGCFILAQETGAPIIPLSWRAMLQIRIPLKYTTINVPLPFNSIELKLGSPITIDRHYQFTELEGIREKLSRELDRLSAKK